MGRFGWGCHQALKAMKLLRGLARNFGGAARTSSLNSALAKYRMEVRRESRLVQTGLSWGLKPKDMASPGSLAWRRMHLTSVDDAEKALKAMKESNDALNKKIKERMAAVKAQRKGSSGVSKAADAAEPNAAAMGLAESALWGAGLVGGFIGTRRLLKKPKKKADMLTSGPRRMKLWDLRRKFKRELARETELTDIAAGMGTVAGFAGGPKGKFAGGRRVYRGEKRHERKMHGSKVEDLQHLRSAYNELKASNDTLAAALRVNKSLLTPIKERLFRAGKSPRVAEAEDLMGNIPVRPGVLDDPIVPNVAMDQTRRLRTNSVSSRLEGMGLTRQSTALEAINLTRRLGRLSRDARSLVSSGTMAPDEVRKIQDRFRALRLAEGGQRGPSPNADRLAARFPQLFSAVSKSFAKEVDTGNIFQTIELYEDEARNIDARMKAMMHAGVAPGVTLRQRKMEILAARQNILSQLSSIQGDLVDAKTGRLAKPHRRAALREAATLADYTRERPGERFRDRRFMDIGARVLGVVSRVPMLGKLKPKGEVGPVVTRRSARLAGGAAVGAVGGKVATYFGAPQEAIGIGAMVGLGGQGVRELNRIRHRYRDLLRRNERMMREAGIPVVSKSVGYAKEVWDDDTQMRQMLEDLKEKKRMADRSRNRTLSNQLRWHIKQGEELLGRGTVQHLPNLAGFLSPKVKDKASVRRWAEKEKYKVAARSVKMQRDAIAAGATPAEARRDAMVWEGQGAPADQHGRLRAGGPSGAQEGLGRQGRQARRFGRNGSWAVPGMEVRQARRHCGPGGQGPCGRPDRRRRRHSWRCDRRVSGSVPVRGRGPPQARLGRRRLPSGERQASGREAWNHQGPSGRWSDAGRQPDGRRGHHGKKRLLRRRRSRKNSRTFRRGRRQVLGHTPSPSERLGAAPGPGGHGSRVRAAHGRQGGAGEDGNSGRSGAPRAACSADPGGGCAAASDPRS